MGVWFSFYNMRITSILFVCYMNESGWRVLRVVLFLQMTTTLPLRLRHQNYPRRCTYEVFSKWQRLRGKNEKQFWKQWRKFKAWFIFRHKFIYLFIYLLFLQSFEHVWTRPTEQFRLMDCGVVCLSRYFTSMSNFLLAGCTE